MAIQQAKNIGATKLSILKDNNVDLFYNFNGGRLVAGVSPSYNNELFSNAIDIAPALLTLNANDTIEIARNDDYVVYIWCERILDDSMSGNPYRQIVFYCYISDHNYENKEIILNNVSPLLYVVFAQKKVYLPVYLNVLFSDETEVVKMSVSWYASPNFFTDETTFNTANNSHILNNGGYPTISENSLYNKIRGLLRENFSDPWEYGGIAGIGGGEGSFDFKSDVLELPAIPAIDALSTGFMTLYVSSLQKIRDLANYMWTSDFLTNVVKITADPMDIIMSLYLFPFNVPYTTSKEVGAGNVHTNITMGVPDSQFFEIDCGSLDIPNFYGAYLDYDPYTKCSIFLPYCGMFEVSLDDIMGKNVAIKYRVDLVTGVCCAYLIVNNSAIYSFTGMCAVSIPVSARNFENQYNAFMSIASALVNPVGGIIDVGSDIASAVMQSKPTIQRSGNVNSNMGFLGRQKPYFIFTVPNVAIPKNQNKFIGYPIFATYLLKDLAGYTEVEKIHLENMGCATENEIDEIERLLKEGVIL